MKRWVLPLILCVVLGILAAQYFVSSTASPGQWSYSDLINHAQAGQVASITIGTGTGVATDTSGHKYNVSLPQDQSVTLGDELKAYGVKRRFISGHGRPGDDADQLSPQPAVPASHRRPRLLVVQVDATQPGAGDVVRPVQSAPHVTAAVRGHLPRCRRRRGGQDGAHRDRRVPEVPREVRRARRAHSHGRVAGGPAGHRQDAAGPAVAGEAGVPFFSISGSEFVEMFVGVGASRVRDLFDQAKSNAPCIVFVDEIDAVGRQRGAGLGGGHDEREQTLNQILVEMDGFDTNTNVIVIAATNRPDVLDPALLRPGRFDRQVMLDRPDIRGRRGDPRRARAQQAARHDGRPRRARAADARLLRRRPGQPRQRSGDPRGAANKKAIGMQELEEAIDRVIAGPERKSRRISDDEKEIVAYHEGGHALVMHVLPHCDPVHKVTIISRGMALGWTLSLPSEDQYLDSRDEFEEQIAASWAGASPSRSSSAT